MAGNCLRFTQSVYGAPARYETAWQAWENTELKHVTLTMPDVSVPVWFDHWGTYSNGYGQYGHVVAWVPGKGFLSSPGKGYGQQWLSTISEVEDFYNSTYVGWSEDINGLRTAIYTQPSNRRKSNTMATIYYTTKNGVTTYALAGDGAKDAAWLETQDVTLATQLVAAHHISQTAVHLSNDTFNAWKGKYLAK